MANVDQPESGEQNNVSKIQSQIEEASDAAKLAIIQWSDNDDVVSATETLRNARNSHPHSLPVLVVMRSIFHYKPSARKKDVDPGLDQLRKSVEQLRNKELQVKLERDAFVTRGLLPMVREGVRKAQYMLGEWLMLVDRNISAAVPELEKAVEAGDVDAMVTLSRHFGDINLHTQEIPLLQMAAERQHPRALNNLATLYNSGAHGIIRDRNKAIQCYSMAAALGYSYALFNLARSHATGSGVPIDKNKYYEFLQLAAEASDTDALEILGRRAPPGSTEAENFFVKAANCGNTECLYKFIATLLEVGDYNRAVALLDHLITLDESQAAITLANMYETGLHVPRNLDKALELHKKAHALGYISEIGIARVTVLLSLRYKLLTLLMGHHIRTGAGSIIQVLPLFVLQDIIKIAWQLP